MKLRNKKTGEIVEFKYLQSDHVAPLVLTTYENDKPEMYKYNSLAELCEEWEDYEEPKGIQCIYYVNHFDAAKLDGVIVGFETKEEAELAVRKLKAWKRLKDGGITFKNWSINQTGTIDCFATWGDNIPPSRKDPTLQEDLDLLFGGEE